LNEEVAPSAEPHDQESSDSWRYHLSELRTRCAERHRARHALPRNDAGNERLTHRMVERPSHPGDEGKREEMPDLRFAGNHHDAHHNSSDQQDGLGAHQQPAAIHAVCRHARWWRQHQERQQTDPVQHAQQHGGAAHVVDKPAQGQLLDPLAGAHEHGSCQQQAKVRMAQRSEPIGVPPHRRQRIVIDRHRQFRDGQFRDRDGRLFRRLDRAALPGGCLNRSVTHDGPAVDGARRILPYDSNSGWLDKPSYRARGRVVDQVHRATSTRPSSRRLVCS
jgi:transposase-like protein